VDDWVAWVIAAGALAVGEMLTTGFFLGPVALGALLAAVAALIGLGTALQFAVFAVAAVASLALIRPIARRHLVMPAHLRTGAAALVGARAVVLERVDVHGGQVKIGGEVWSARAYDDDEVLEAGAQVHVMEIEGATALVSE
jgi:membrane protein implicated in regulation of membrane protease activity